ncbi:coxsackievirus and adenovirus receptor homolog [Archocentrus centrarchus]|uniref:coxsackievirus and adenovirus receptor homolog n=1 Tax=Archocentrus centrarchus TaxID=63155 RepID=UPI0011E9DC8B|nr:coxsackievirus and adenovirus receptor homolog [Archocentrus centrarchus]
MFVVTSRLCFWICVAVITCSQHHASAEQKIITAESGQNVTLTCRAPKNNIILGVDWSRADLGDEYVLLYRDGHFDSANQHPSFKDQVDLQDKQMKDGDASLILKNVTINDTGTYECRLKQRRTNRRKRAVYDTEPISIINLRVVAPPGPGGSGGLITGLSVPALLLVAAAAAVVF